MGGAANVALTPVIWLPDLRLSGSGLLRLRLALAAAIERDLADRDLADRDPADRDLADRHLAARRPRAVRAAVATEPAPDQRWQPTGQTPDAEQIALVEQAVGGDSAAFGQLYDRYADLVYRYICYRVGQPALAEDLTSETFLRALRSIAGYQMQGKDFGAWLVTIARNLIADHYKSSRYRLELSTAELTDIPSQPVAGPEQQVLDAISNEALLAAVARLNPEQQECIALRFLQGLSVSETAQLMGKREGAIKALQFRAIRALARLVPVDAS